MENPYAPIPAVLDEVVDETPTIKTFVLSPKQPVEFQAGQFVQITVPGLGEAPFTPSSSPYEKGFLEVTVLRTGRVTDAMHELKPGATLGVRGPFGKGYPLDQCEGKEVLVIGGGVGLAPLRSLIYALLGQLDRVKRVAIKYGAREPDELLY
ncbi:oxidoreductase, partial [bacterium]|nr:oxidoreductase [bacterium]